MGTGATSRYPRADAEDNPDPPQVPGLYGVSAEGALTSERFSVGQNQEYGRYTPSVENPDTVIYDTISTFPIRSYTANDVISGAPCNHGHVIVTGSHSPSKSAAALSRSSRSPKPSKTPESLKPSKLSKLRKLPIIRRLSSSRLHVCKTQCLAIRGCFPDLLVHIFDVETRQVSILNDATQMQKFEVPHSPIRLSALSFAHVTECVELQQDQCLQLGKEDIILQCRTHATSSVGAKIHSTKNRKLSRKLCN